MRTNFFVRLGGFALTFSLVVAPGLIPPTAKAADHPSAPFTEEGGQFLVELGIDGHAQRLVLDSGASFTAIFANADNESYPAHGQSSHRGVGGKEITCDDIVPDSVTLGTIVRERFLVRRCGRDFPGLGGFGLLGIDYLMGKRVLLSFSSRRLTEVSELPEAFSEVPLRQLASGQVTVPVLLGGSEQWGVFDTGWSGASAIDASVVRKQRKRFRFVGETTVTDPSGAVTKMRVYRLLGAVKIGTRRFRNVLFAAQPGLARTIQAMSNSPTADTTMILSAQILMQADWVLDLKDGRAFEAPLTHRNYIGP